MTTEEKIDTNHIHIRLLSTNGQEVHFKISKTTQFRKLFSVYAERAGINEENIKFLFDGKRIDGEQTPKSLEMEDHDVIDAVLAQTGGYNIIIK